LFGFENLRPGYPERVLPLIYHKLPFFQRKTKVFSLFHPKIEESKSKYASEMPKARRKYGENTLFPD